MRLTTFAVLLLVTSACRPTRPAQTRPPATLTRADSVRIAASVVSGFVTDSARYGTLLQFLARLDSLRADPKTNQRRYVNLRVF
jgi:hypothetical protein